MIEATKVSFWGRSYHITVDGRPVAEWNPSFWRTGGEIVLDGQRFQVKAATWSNRYTMLDHTGTPVAEAERVGRKRWTVFADGTPHQFRRASLFSYTQLLVVGDNPVGSIRRAGFWSGRVEAELPTLSLAAQVFAVGVVIAMWNRQAAAAGAS